MRYLLLFTLLFTWSTTLFGVDGFPDEEAVTEVQKFEKEVVLETNKSLRVSVIGQGVAPSFTTSPGQAYALAKRAAMVDGYRLIAERIKGVRVEGQDTIQNMMVKRSSVRTNVTAMIRNATVAETTYKDGICEVEMEIVIHYSQFAQ